MGLEHRREFSLGRKKKHVRKHRGKNITFRNICIQKFVRGKRYIKKPEKEGSGGEHGNQKRIVALKLKMVSFTW